MNVSGQNLFRLLRIFSLPAYAVLFSSLALMIAYRFLHSFSSLDSVIFYYAIICTVYFAVYGWYVCIATTLGMVGCYILILRRGDIAPANRRWASVIALSATVAFGLSALTVPLIIPTP